MPERTIRGAGDRISLSTPVGERSLTKQSFKDQADVNLVVRRYATEGTLPYVNPRPGVFGDVSGAVQLQEAIELVRDANDSFQGLPSSVRTLADNSAVNFLQMLSTPDGVSDLQEVGFLPTPPAPTPVVETPPTPAAPPASTDPT